MCFSSYFQKHVALVKPTPSPPYLSRQAVALNDTVPQLEALVNDKSVVAQTQGEVPLRELALRPSRQ